MTPIEIKDSYATVPPPPAWVSRWTKTPRKNTAPGREPQVDWETAAVLFCFSRLKSLDPTYGIGGFNVKAFVVSLKA